MQSPRKRENPIQTQRSRRRAARDRWKVFLKNILYSYCISYRSPSVSAAFQPFILHSRSFHSCIIPQPKGNMKRLRPFIIHVTFKAVVCLRRVCPVKSQTSITQQLSFLFLTLRPSPPFFLRSFFVLLRLLRLVLTPPSPLTGRRPRCPAWSSPRGAPSGPPLRGVSGTSSEFAKKANVDFEETKLSLHHTLMKKG